MISIIIPALNEENYLTKLLKSISRQNFKDYEIILADAGSEDKTVEIAKSHKAVVVRGGLPGKGRNEGAKVAKGELLFFADADVVLPDGFLKKGLAEFKSRNLDLASFRLAPFSCGRFASFAFDFFYNRPIVLLEKALPHAAMGIFIKKGLFKKLGGFDESIKLAEDHFLARRAVKNFKAKFGIIRSVKIFVSVRRFKTDGWLFTGIKFLLCELHMIFLGPVMSDIFKYRFGHYKRN